MYRRYLNQKQGSKNRTAALPAAMRRYNACIMYAQ